MSVPSVCSRCLMDQVSDPEIEFDEHGHCNHCRKYESRVVRFAIPPSEKAARRERVVQEIKTSAQGKPYDCIVGVSGGVDSTYLVWLAKSLGLRVLAVHLDNGWDTELAVKNIEVTLKRLNVPLYTHVLDWDEFRSWQKAMIQAGTPDLEMPTDHSIFGLLHRVAAQQGVQHILSGTNLSSEGVGDLRWTYGMFDWRYLNGVNRRFGGVSLKSVPSLPLWRLAYYRLIKRIKLVSLLDYVEYKKEEAVQTLVQELGWRPYEGKHHESTFTRWFQSYYLPKKFHLDKRRLYLSSLVLSGQMSREQGVEELKKPSLPEDQIRADTEFVAKKLGWSHSELEQWIAGPKHTYRDYPAYCHLWWYKYALRLYRSGWLPKIW